MEARPSKPKKLSTSPKNNSYYGKMAKIEISDNVTYMIIDEHMQRIIDKYGAKFMLALEDILKDFKKDLLEKFKNINQKQATSNAFMKVELKALQKRFEEREKRDKRTEEFTLKSLAKKHVMDIQEDKESKQIYESLKEKGIIKDKLQYNIASINHHILKRILKCY